MSAILIFDTVYVQAPRNAMQKTIEKETVSSPTHVQFLLPSRVVSLNPDRPFERLFRVAFSKGPYLDTRLHLLS
jgi:hypothetical protein